MKIFQTNRRQVLILVMALLLLPSSAVLASERCILLSEGREITLQIPQRLGENRNEENLSLICGGTPKLNMRAILLSKYENNYEAERQRRWRLAAFKETRNIGGRRYYLPSPQANMYLKSGRGAIAYTCVSRWFVNSASSGGSAIAEKNQIACKPEESAMVIIAQTLPMRKNVLCVLRFQSIQNDLNVLVLGSERYMPCSGLLDPELLPEIEKAIYLFNYLGEEYAGSAN